MFRFLALGLIGLAGPAAAQTSNAAAYLLDEQLTAACGTDASAFMDPAGLIERDFDGDGRLDLLISHEGITCPNAEFNTRSGYCGVQVCSVLLLPSARRSACAGRRISGRRHRGQCRDAAGDFRVLPRWGNLGLSVGRHRVPLVARWDRTAPLHGWPC